MEIDQYPLRVRAVCPQTISLGPIKTLGGVGAEMKADVPRMVHREFIPLVLAAGGSILDSEGDVVEVKESEPSPDETRMEKLIEACKELILTNEVRNFTRTGRPRIEAVRNLVDFDFDMDELRLAYDIAATPEESVNDDPSS